MVAFVNWLISQAGTIISAILSLLPQSPFTYDALFDQSWLGAMNWLFPISEAIAILQLYVVAVIAYYVIRIPMRWLKASGG